MYIEKVKGLEVLIGLLIVIAFITLGERKILGCSQKRKGPNKVGYMGIAQALSDGIKLILKEGIIPNKGKKIVFIISPMITLSISIIIWMVIPYYKGITFWDEKLTILLILALSSINIYGILYSGWSSNSRYSIIGSLRAISQLISYEISIGLILMNVVIISNSLNIIKISMDQIYIYNIIALFPIFVLLYISILAETNRHPFDLVEAESELVAGYIVEYSSMLFASIYLSEYGNIITMSALMNILFFNGQASSIITIILIILFIKTRALLPRVKWNNLIKMGWSKILPSSIGYIIFNLSLNYLLIYF